MSFLTDSEDLNLAGIPSFHGKDHHTTLSTQIRIMKCLRVIDICVLTLVTRVHGHDSSDDGSDEWRTASSRRHRRLRKAPISERRDLGAGPVVSPIFCSSNMDCNSTMYCAAGECLEMGSCETNMDCRNPSNLHFVDQGSGPLICLEHNKQCGLECPVCEDGLKPADQQCDVVPCDITDTICRWTNFVDSCQNDYSNGCNALVFDEAGYHELCIGPFQPVETTPCSSTSDCALDGSEYCSRGTCRARGQCSSDADCFNPDNNYTTIDCAGPLSCSDNGQCRRTCADSGCPNDVTEVSMECSILSCDAMADSCIEDSTSCADYSCGDCKSLAFNQSGFAVCQVASRVNSVNATVNFPVTVWNPWNANKEIVLKWVSALSTRIAAIWAVSTL